MHIQEALDIIAEIKDEMGEGLLETMIYMNDNLDQFSDRQQLAYRVAFRDFQKLFAPA